MDFSKVKENMEIDYVGQSKKFSGTYIVQSGESLYGKECPEKLKNVLYIHEFSNSGRAMEIRLDNLKPSDWKLSENQPSYDKNITTEFQPKSYTLKDILMHEEGIPNNSLQTQYHLTKENLNKIIKGYKKETKNNVKILKINFKDKSKAQIEMIKAPFLDKEQKNKMIEQAAKGISNNNQPHKERSR